MIWIEFIIVNKPTAYLLWGRNVKAKLLEHGSIEEKVICPQSFGNVKQHLYTATKKKIF